VVAVFASYRNGEPLECHRGNFLHLCPDGMEIVDGTAITEAEVDSFTESLGKGIY
jgi:hypothetical protein